MTKHWWKPDRPLTELEEQMSGAFADVRDRVPKRYNPNHDEHGQFSSGGDGGGDQSTAAEATGEEAATQVAAAATRIEQAVPQAHVDLGLMDPHMADTVANSVESFATNYPNAATDIERVEMRDLDEGIIAQTTPNIDGEPQSGDFKPEAISGFSVIVNDKYFGEGNAAEGLDAVRSDYAAEYHPYDTIQGAIDHEMGHVLDSYTARTQGFDKMPTNLVVAHIQDTVHGDFSNERVVRAVDEVMGRADHSGYGLSAGPSEVFAEAFAVAQAGRGDELSPFMRGLLTDVADWPATPAPRSRSTAELYQPVSSFSPTCEGFISPATLAKVRRD